MIENSSTIVRTMTTAMRTWVDDRGCNGHHGVDFDQHKNGNVYHGVDFDLHKVGDVYHEVDFAYHGVNGEVPGFDCNRHDFEFREPET